MGIKNSFAAVAVLALIGFGAEVDAFDLGDKLSEGLEKGVETGTKVAVAQKINKNIKEKRCAFKPKKTELTCDLDDLLTTLDAQKEIVEESKLSKDVQLFVEVGRGKDPSSKTLAEERTNLVRSRIKKRTSGWEWNDSLTEGDKLIIFVKIK